MNTKRKPRLPSEIKLPERVKLEGGAVFVTLHTLGELEVFWKENRAEFPCAAKGDQPFLDEYEWVFAPTKAVLVKTVTRWEQMEIRCEWYDWATADPDMHAFWFRDRDEYRNNQIKAGKWTEAEECEYKEDCRVRSPETYRGWWTLSNLPGECSFSDWLSFADEINDRSLELHQVERMMQEQTFEDWMKCGDDRIRFHDAASLDEEIAYWRTVQRNGEDYYGSENEQFLSSKH